MRPIRHLGLPGILLLLTCIVSSCTWRDRDGVVHHLVLGIGLVSVKQDPEAKTTATRSNVLGLHASGGSHPQLTVGLSSVQATSIGTGARDVRMEVSHRPFGALRVQVACNQYEGDEGCPEPSEPSEPSERPDPGGKRR